MDGILDFSKDLDIGLLDNVVRAMYTGAGNDQKMAQQALAQFQEHPDAWQRVPAILQQSSSAHTKVIFHMRYSFVASVTDLVYLSVHCPPDLGQAHRDEMEGAASRSTTG